MNYRPDRHPHRAAFTLIEGLTVMVIMGILLSLGGASLLGTRAGKDADSALVVLRARLDSARWQAMTLRTRCRLVIATADNPTLNTRLGANPALRTYAIARWNSDLLLWEVISEWHALPTGLGFVTSDSPADLGPPWNARSGGLGVVSGNRDTLTTLDLNRDQTLTPADALNAAWVEFLPDGTVEQTSRGDDAASFWSIAIAEGEVSSEGLFQPRPNGRIRPIALDVQTGLLTIDP